MSGGTRKEPRVGAVRYWAYTQPLLRRLRRTAEQARRLVDRRPLVYISAQAPPQPLLDELLYYLRSAGLRTLWTDVHRGYVRIEDDIDRSDALLAVISAASRGSTWQADELSVGCGQPGMSDVRPKSRPVFIYKTIEVTLGYEHSLTLTASPFYLDAQPQEAAALIADTLRRRRTT